MQITKVKLKLDQTEVYYTNEGSHTISETKVKCDEPRDPAFTDDVQSLMPHVVKLLGLPAHWISFEDMIVCGVSFNENDSQGMGAVITVLKKLENFNSPLVINTPHMCEGQEAQTKSLLPTDLKDILNRIDRHAKAFVDGKRAQQSLLGKLDPESTSKKIIINYKTGES